jgi:hypothetical protein
MVAWVVRAVRVAAGVMVRMGALVKTAQTA